MRVYYSLYGRLLSIEALYNGFKKVWKAKGAAGIDGQSLSDYASNLGGNLRELLLELREKRYQPLPVKRVEIDKDDGGKRLLGIPAVRDRIVQQALLDILILCSSKAAAENALQVATSLLEKDLKLTVNRNKTHLAHSDNGVKFLGVEIRSVYTRIQEKKLKKLKEKVRQLTRRTSWTNVDGVIRQLNPVTRGFANYFRIANCSREFKRLMGWIRRRLRCIQLRQWKKPAKLHRRPKQLGYKPPFKYIKKCVHGKMQPVRWLTLPCQTVGSMNSSCSIWKK